MRNIILGLFVLIIASASIGGGVFAQSVGGYAPKAMPEFELLSRDEFEAATSLITQAPPEHEALKYSIRFPKDWTKINHVGDGNFSLRSKIFSELARFFSPARVVGPRSRLMIKAMKLDYKVTAEHWLLDHLKKSGTNIEGFRVHSRNRAEVMKIIVERGQSYAVRSLVDMNGGNLVFVEYFLPTDFWAEEKVMQEQVVNSFVFLNPEEENLVEDMQFIDFLDVARLSYPSSWEAIFSPFRSVDFLEASIVNFPVQFKESGQSSGAAVDGKVEIEIVSAHAIESLEAQIEAYKEKLSARGIQFGERVDIDDVIEVDDAFDFARFEAYKIDDESGRLSDYEIWYGLLSAADYFYFVTLLTPAREYNFGLWSRNTQSYRLMMNSLASRAEIVSLP